jgi:hypothetical protein
VPIAIPFVQKKILTLMLDVIVTLENQSLCAGELLRGTIQTPAGPEHLYTLKTHLIGREKIRCPESNDNPAYADTYTFLKLPITPIIKENPNESGNLHKTFITQNSRVNEIYSNPLFFQILIFGILKLNYQKVRV